MKKLFKVLSSSLLALLLAFSMLACQQSPDSTGTSSGGEQQPEFIDYVENLTFDENSGRAHQEVTVKSYIDGDTTHFHLTTPIYDRSVLKARYLAVDTPESTGKIEPYGKKAASFTKEKLKSATSIIVESNSEKWEYDSTGDRMLVWVWYKPAGATKYRNLNVEIYKTV